jgi:hypothetical protein
MYMSCSDPACDRNETHGNAANITYSRLIAAAIASSISVEDVIVNLVQTLEAMNQGQVSASGVDQDRLALKSASLTPGLPRQRAGGPGATPIDPVDPYLDPSPGETPMPDMYEQMHRRLMAKVPPAEREKSMFAAVVDFKEQALAGQISTALLPPTDRELVARTAAEFLAGERRQKGARARRKADAQRIRKAATFSQAHLGRSWERVKKANALVAPVAKGARHRDVNPELKDLLRKEFADRPNGVPNYDAMIAMASGGTLLKAREGGASTEDVRQLAETMLLTADARLAIRHAAARAVAR